MKIFYDEIIGKINSKAWEDSSFMKKLKSSPKVAFEEIAEIRLPEKLNVQVHDADARTIHFVMPPDPNKISTISKFSKELAELYTNMFYPGDTVRLREVPKHEIQRYIASRIYIDQEFCDKLQREPKKVLAEILKAKVPEETTLKFHQNTEDQLHLVLLPKQSQPAKGGQATKLSESQLQQVTGGIFVDPISIMAVSWAVGGIAGYGFARDLGMPPAGDIVRGIKNLFS